MRDPKKYTDAKRNDPHSSKQKVEHPYDFVSFPDRAEPIGTEQVKRLYHDRNLANTLTGKIVIELTAQSSLTVGSGLFENAGDVGLTGHQVVRGIVLRDGKPVIPGSSIKGAVRSNYELITQSSMAVFGNRASEKYDAGDRKYSKIPKPVLEDAGLTEKGKVQIKLDDSVNQFNPKTVVEPADLANLCPASALFGAMGYRGRIHFNDAVVVEMPKRTQPIETPPMNQPHLHRVGFTIQKENQQKPYNEKRNSLIVKELFGRKVYYNTEGEDSGNEPSDFLPKGTRLQTELTFHSLLPEELGGLLTALATNDEFLFRLGGGKPAGRGKIQVRLIGLELTQTPKNRYLKYKSEVLCSEIVPTEKDLKAKFQAWRFFFKKGLDELKAITQMKKPLGEKS